MKSAATCTAKAVYYKSCVCGDKGTDTFENGEILTHTYDQEVVSTEYLKSAATCTAKAVYYKSCICGAKGTETFENGSPLAHTYNQEVVSTDYLKSAATCTAKAVYYKSCVCGAMGTDTFEVGSALDHLFTSYVANNDATCTENGTETANCDRDNCDATDTKTVADSALGHSYEKHKTTDLSQIFAYRTATEWQNCDGLTLSSTVTACKWLANGGQAGDITNDEAALLIAGIKTNAVSKTAAKRGVTLTKTSDFYVLTASFKAVYNAGNCVNGVKLKVTNGKDQYCLLFVSRDGGNVNSIENTSGASTALGTLPADAWLDVVIVMDVVNQKVVYYLNGVKTAEITTAVPDGLDEVSLYVDKAGKDGKLFLGNFALYQGDANHLSLASVLAATNASASTVPTLTSDDEYTVDEPATCTTAGSKSIHCCRCTATKDSAVIPAFGHTEQWKTNAVATIFADGSRTKTCLTCQTKLSEETLPKLSPSNVYSSMKSDTKDLTVFDENTASFTTLGIEGGAAEFGEKDFFFEFSYLYNDTAATNKLGEPNMQLYLYTTETTLPIANLNIKTGNIYFKNIEEEDLEEGMSAPSVYFAYGWHRFGIQIRQEATIVAGAVKYATKYRLYVDGVLANAPGTWSYAKEDVNTKLLFFKATVNENDPTALDYAAPTNALSIKLTLAKFYSLDASKTVIIPMDAYELTAKKLDRSVDTYAYADLFSMNVVCLDSTGQNANTPVYDLGDGGTFPTQTILATAKIGDATVNGYEYNLPDVTYYRVVGGALAKAPIPVREGYTFAGWSAGNVANSKITFEAQWTPND